jgi:hypothetical protein
MVEIPDDPSTMNVYVVSRAIFGSRYNIRLHSQQQQSELEAGLEVTLSPGVEGLDSGHTHPPVMKAPARKKQKQTKTQDERRQQKKSIYTRAAPRRIDETKNCTASSYQGSCW